jgi:FdhE protein
LSAATEIWVEAHPYLRRVSELTDVVERAATETRVPPAAPPDWQAYRGDYLAGVPLLRSSSPLVDLEPAGKAAAALVGRLASDAPAGRVRDEAAALDGALARDPAAGRRVADFLLGDDSWTPPSPGLLRYAGWTTAALYLRRLVNEFARWRDEERWQRRWCPTCGSEPSMAQLSDAESARVRWLCCGCCRSRWQYTRTKCPFCEADSQKLSIVTVEGEGGLRIDWCESCRGYLKTYAAQGNESLMLSDWSSLHLDLAAQERGLKRMAASLYELETAGRAG